MTHINPAFDQAEWKHRRYTLFPEFRDGDFPAKKCRPAENPDEERCDEQSFIPGGRTQACFLEGKDDEN